MSHSLLFLSLLGLAVTTAIFLARQARTTEREIAERLRELEAERERESKMLTDLTHNLQTPLAVLKGKVERYERTMLHDGQPGTIGQSVDTVSRFINEMLAFSNLERTIREEERRIFSFSGLVQDVVEDARTLAEGDLITISEDVESGIEFFGNEHRLSDALMNLLGNAVKYMGNGPVRHVRVSLKRQSGQLMLNVTDTGIGIPEDELPHIFTRFYRGSARTYGTVPGTGLGLAFVERIAKEHDGAITVTSEIGKGSSFTLILPGSPPARSKKSHA